MSKILAKRVLRWWVWIQTTSKIAFGTNRTLNSSSCSVNTRSLSSLTTKVYNSTHLLSVRILYLGSIHIVPPKIRGKSETSANTLAFNLPYCATAKHFAPSPGQVYFRLKDFDKCDKYGKLLRIDYQIWYVAEVQLHTMVIY